MEEQVLTTRRQALLQGIPDNVQVIPVQHAEGVPAAHEDIVVGYVPGQQPEAGAGNDLPPPPAVAGIELPPPPPAGLPAPGGCAGDLSPVAPLLQNGVPPEMLPPPLDQRELDMSDRDERRRSRSPVGHERRRRSGTPQQRSEERRRQSESPVRRRATERRPDERHRRSGTPGRRRTPERHSEECRQRSGPPDRLRGTKRRSDEHRRRSDTPERRRRATLPEPNRQHQRRPENRRRQSGTPKPSGRRRSPSKNSSREASSQNQPYWLPKTIDECHDGIKRLRNNLKLTGKDYKLQKSLVAEKERQLKDKDSQLKEKNEQIQEKDKRLNDCRDHIQSLTSLGRIRGGCSVLY
ncbi:hypothetical protein QAD02_021583 [Eretmocerus hayati]|uniref:Uncharacterized protein n=1 Tax=Eretmocerus hayati TaxID=131215 RepID=A0ACC2PQV9_9HYME|nr:hypothetical protein QAD02_021583 [Eretmocerus hayati]